MMVWNWKQGATICALAAVLLQGSGCATKDHLVFVTATKFGLDASQLPDQPPRAILGYKRMEYVSNPATKQAAEVTDDLKAVKTETFSTYSSICVMANPSIWKFIKDIVPGTTPEDSLQIRSVFITGIAARSATKHPDILDQLNNVIDPRNGSDLKCFENKKG